MSIRHRFADQVPYFIHWEYGRSLFYAKITIARVIPDLKCEGLDEKFLIATSQAELEKVDLAAVEKEQIDIFWNQFLQNQTHPKN